jgi:tetratricopeptide (TPR) repeat protein
VSHRSKPLYFHFRYFKGRCYLKAERFDRAIETFQSLRTAFGSGRFGCPLESFKLHYYLGRSSEATNQPDKAVAQYEESLEWWKNADPGLESIVDARQRLTRLKGTI